jgi:hypothetical protein
VCVYLLYCVSKKSQLEIPQIYMCTHIYMHTRVRTRTRAHTHTNTHTHIHTHTNTHTHTKRTHTVHMIVYRSGQPTCCICIAPNTCAACARHGNQLFRHQALHNKVDGCLRSGCLVQRSCCAVLLGQGARAACIFK